jgi:gliding motility-associated-like protein
MLRYIYIISIKLLLSFWFFLQVADTAGQSPPSSIFEQNKEQFSFLKNQGQILDSEGNERPDIYFKGSGKFMDVYLTNKGISYVFLLSNSYTSPTAGTNDDETKPIDILVQRTDMHLLGINKAHEILAEQPKSGYHNFYNGKIQSSINNVQSYQKITYKNVYDNIDWLVTTTNTGKVKHEFIVYPGGDPSDIQITYQGFENISKEEGKLHVNCVGGTIEEDRPLTYQQQAGGMQKVIPSSYTINENVVSYRLGKYDQSKTLVIDPALTWSTYYGGSSVDVAGDIKADQNGDIYVTGNTISMAFPTLDAAGPAYYQNVLAGVWDAYILKFSPTGILIWATYYGGSSNEFEPRIDFDSNNDAFVTGRTYSNDFPVFNPGNGAWFQGNLGGDADAFILQFDSNGSRKWATYYGGSLYDHGTSVVLNSQNEVIITGYTGSSNFPVFDAPGNADYFDNSFNGGSYDLFFAKFNNTGIRQWSTYYGGSSRDECYRIAVDASDNLYACGNTGSADFPTNAFGTSFFDDTFGSLGDGFILRFDASCALQWSTYFGGSNIIDYITGISIDNSDNIVIAGITGGGNNFPLLDPGTGNYHQGVVGGGFDIFVSQFNDLGVQQWCTFYGGSGDDLLPSVDHDDCGNSFILGYSNSTNLYTNSGVGSFFQPANNGANDFFLLCLDELGNDQWATYMGGNGDDSFGYISCDQNSDLLVVGGSASVANFPLQNAGTYFNGANQGIVDLVIQKYTHSAAQANASFNYPLNTYCSSDPNPLPNISGDPGGIFSINNGGTINAGTGSIDLSVTGPGNYIITYQVGGGCPDIQTFNITVALQADASFNFASVDYCENDPNPVPIVTGDQGGSFTINNTGAINPVTGEIDLNNTVPGNYIITYMVGGQCSDLQTFNVTINQQADASFNFASATFCENDPNPLPVVTGDQGGTFTINNGGVINAGTGQPDLTLTSSGNYVITYSIGGPCPDTQSFNITILPQADASFVFSDSTFCINNSDPTPIIIGDSGGIFSISNGGIIDPLTGSVDLSGSLLGNFTVTYSVAGGCPDQQSFNLTIENIANAAIQYSNSVYCTSDANPIAQIIGTGGGTFSNSSGLVFIDNSSGEIDLSGSLPGNHLITYIIDGACGDTTTYSLEIVPEADATIVPATPTCISDNPTQLNALFPGGIWSGSGITDSLNGAFDPAVAGAGFHTITYSMGGLCPANETMVIEVIDFCEEVVLIIPNVFTPNGDGSNDNFFITTTHITSLEGSIYNRWGEILFYLDGVNSQWNGRTSAGTLVPDGTYFCMIKALGRDGNVYEKQSPFLLVRNQ